MKLKLSILALAMLSACSATFAPRKPPAITAQEQALLDNPSPELLRAIEAYVPQASAELRKSEAVALQKGRALTDEELVLAKRVGVKHPEKIRIYFTSTFPINEDEIHNGGDIVALTMNYGIFVKPYVSFRREAYLEIITHEFAHVVQFERIGVEGMSRRFNLETFILRDKLIPIEREAIAMGEAVYDDPQTSYGFFKLAK